MLFGSGDSGIMKWLSISKVIQCSSIFVNSSTVQHLIWLLKFISDIKFHDIFTKIMS